jgi:hypothetical protein
MKVATKIRINHIHEEKFLSVVKRSPLDILVKQQKRTLISKKLKEHVISIREILVKLDRME